MEKKIYILTVKNWNKYNPTEMIKKTPSWFRVNKDIATSEHLFGLSLSQKWIWICLLSLCCVKKSDKISFNLRYYSHHWSISENDILDALKKFNEISLIEANSELAPLSTPSELGANSVIDSELQDKTRQYFPKGKSQCRTKQVGDNGPSGLVEQAQPLNSFHWLIEIWNSSCGNRLSQVRSCSKSRLKKIHQRVKEHPDQDFWKSAIQKCVESKFLTGFNDRAWKASFDWIIANDTNILKITEGRYDNSNSINWDKVF